jgi:hypothetical protein
MMMAGTRTIVLGLSMSEYFVCVSVARLTGRSLQEFFASALDDWSEDSDVEGALKMLGMESLNDKFKGLEINLMAHQVLGVAFMLEKERNRKFRGGILADAMGIGKVGCLCEISVEADVSQTDHTDTRRYCGKSLG